jgi:hypothetical protein
MTPFASLPMYNFPEMRSANAQFWGALRGLLLEAGLGDVPETLVFERGPVPARLEAEMLFSQTCGYPLETVFKGQALEEYRVRWKLPADHPITAPAYSERRSTMAQRIGLGRKSHEAVVSTPEVVAPPPKRRGRKPRSAAAE